MDGAMGGSAVRILNNVTKSPADKREFRALELTNGIKVMLIHDEETDKAAAAISVAAGSMCDPVKFPGLAHFLEHMLFLGTEKYPDESGFDTFLNESGGSTNAFTALDITLYHFDVSPEKLSLALDRFAQFFIAPLFNESSTEREVNAVNSEYEKNIPCDYRRLFRIDQATSNQNHPYSKFNTGNRDCLWAKPVAESVDVRKTLIQFHDTYYSANLTTLAVIGKETLDELQSMVQSMFSPVLDKKKEKPIWPDSPYGDDELQLRIDVVPIQDLRKLELKFPILDTTVFYKSAPGYYLSHLLGHKGVGSLLSLLKRNRLANELFAYSWLVGRGFRFLIIDIDLTPEGLRNVNGIVEHVFQYLKMLLEEESHVWVWQEIKDVRDIEFRFQDKPTPTEHVVTLAQKLHDYPLEDVLTAGLVLTEFNQQITKNILNCCVPSKCRVFTVSRENTVIANLTEPWYGAQFGVQKIDPTLIQEWTYCEKHEELKLPEKNQFIPSNFDMKPREDTGIAPIMLVNNPLSRVWFLQDNEFLLPKAHIYLELYSPLPQLQALQCVLTSMMVRVIEDSLTEIVYPASVAGFSQHVSSSIYGMEISVSGYNHKLEVLLNKVLDKIINFSVNPERFTMLKEVYTRDLKNWEDSEPRFHATWYLNHILDEKDWTRQEMLQALEGVTDEDVRVYAGDFISQLRLEWLFYGNLTSLETQEIVKEIQDRFEQKGTTPLVPRLLNRLRSVHLAPGSDKFFQRDHLSHSSSCVVAFFQGGVKNTRDNVTIELLGQIADQPCFQQLRTEEQLGYVVFAGVWVLRGVLGFIVLVQSYFHPLYLESRIDNFLQVLKDKISGMTEEEFAIYRTALKVKKAEKIKTLSARAAEAWYEITIEGFNFDRKNIELKELDSISHHDVEQYFENLIGPPLKDRGRLGIHIISQTKDGAGQKTDCAGPYTIDLSKRIMVPITSISEWKSEQGLHRRPKPELVIPSPVPY